MATWQKCGGARQIHGKSAFNLSKNNTSDTFLLFERGFKHTPSLFTASFIAAKYGLTIAVFHTLDIDLDLVTNFYCWFLARSGKLFKRNASFRFQADVDDYGVALDTYNETADNAALDSGVLAKAFSKKIGKAFCGSIRCRVVLDVKKISVCRHSGPKDQTYWPDYAP